MPKIAYEFKNFGDKALDTIAQANEIIEDYQAQGLVLTLRQLYYQFVSKDLIPNKQAQYKRLGNIVSDARLAGLIDWNAIEDRTRNLMGINTYVDPGDAIRSVVRRFRIDRWEGQAFRPEVWIEKEALTGVISGICGELGIDYFACKGYVSQSEMWRGAMRMKGYGDDDQKPVIIHLGDHDPSGMDMTRDIDDRNGMFAGFGSVEIDRIALNMDQVDEYSPPPNPAKLTDSRAQEYIREYGDDSWELDALDPTTLRDLIRTTVEGYRNDDIYFEVMARESEYLETLDRVAKNWKEL